MSKKYSLKQMVEFGNYLLSKERKQLVKSRPEMLKPEIKQALKEVSNVDISNWKEKNKEIKEGNYVVVIANISDHNFSLGSMVKVQEIEGETYICADLSDSWCLTRTEIKKY